MGISLKLYLLRSDFGLSEPIRDGYAQPKDVERGNGVIELFLAISTINYCEACPSGVAGRANIRS